MIKRVFVNRQVLNQNRKYKKNAPAIGVRTTKGTVYTHRAEILGPASILHSETKPLSCGARSWVETESPVELELPSGKMLLIR